MQARRIDDIDWRVWTPDDVATLVFIEVEGRLLLMRKKRGLGAGKINGPGGKCEPGETIEACAVREVREELCVTPLSLRHCGENRFQFLDGYAIHVHVFHARGLEGEPTETAEAIPLWFGRDEIPYDEMWEDDDLWLPLVLEGRSFDGRFLFDDDRMVDHRLDTPEPDAAGAR